MKDFFYQLSRIITLDIFIGFGLYSLLFVLISIFRRNIPLLEKLDRSATRFIIFAGIVFAVCWTTNVAMAVNEGGTQALRGPYWWVQQFIWIIATQLLWIEKVRRNLIARLIIAIALILSIEHFVILVTSLHRDYRSSGSSLFGMSALEIAIGLTIKMILFCLMAIVYSFVADWIKARVPIKTK